MYMISKNSISKFCCEDVSLIENYFAAIADADNMWECHHRGEILPCGRFSIKDLKSFGLYYGRPASELIYLRYDAHKRLHNRNLSEDTRRMKSDAMMGKKNPSKRPDVRAKLSEALKGKTLSDEHCRKMSEARKGTKFFNDGTRNVIARECPPGFVAGRIKVAS